jgi:PAS domain S-box-containing protein
MTAPTEQKHTLSVRMGRNPYARATLAVAVALLVRLMLSAWLGTAVPLVTFVAAVVVAARWGGLAPGLYATALSAVVAVYFLLPPIFNFSIETQGQRFSFMVFCVIGALISWASGSLRRAERFEHQLALLANERAAAERLSSAGLAATQDELLLERQRVSNLISDVPGVVWQVWGDPGDLAALRTDFVSGYMFRLLGYRPDEFIDHPDLWLHILYPEDRQRVAREAHELFEAGFGGVIELRWIGRDGRLLWIEWHVRTFRDQAGRSMGMRGIAFDVTARRRLEHERAELLSQAQESNRAKDEFLATVSHELRTPINAVLGWTQMLRAGILSPERSSRALESIERNAAAQSRMIEDLLDVSRIVSGKFRLEVEDVDISALASLTVDVVRPAAEAKGITVEVIHNGSPLMIRADPHRLEQAIWNLLSNAVKFTPEQGHVRLETVGHDGGIELVVSDNGEGIAPELLTQVFERFRQADASPTRSHAGLGIGLAIVRHIVELHGGTVRAESAGRGRGTVFRVRLPHAGAVVTGEPSPVSPVLSEFLHRVN